MLDGHFLSVNMAMQTKIVCPSVVLRDVKAQYDNIYLVTTWVMSWDYKNFIRSWSWSWRLEVRVLVRPAKHERFFIPAKPWHFVGWFCPSSDRSTSEKLFSGYFGFSPCLYSSLSAHKSTVLISQHEFYLENTNTCYSEWVKKLHRSFGFSLSPRHHSTM